MDRRRFLRNTGLGLIAAAAPISFSACDSATKKIAKTGKLNLSFKPYELKLKHAFNLAKNSRTTTPDVLIQIEYDGIIGYGEASMPPYLGETTESVQKFLSSVDLSQFNDPFRIEEILQYVDGIAENNRAAKASIDLALHDVLGKIMGQPWHKIWGLSPEKAPVTSYTISTDTDEILKQKIEETKPFKLVKLKMGIKETDKDLLNKFREQSDTQICVDANQGWNTKEEALEMCELLATQNCLFVEQPLPKEMLDETAWLRERSPLPIIADEAFQRLPDVVRFKDVYDGINIKLMKSTGLYEGYKMAVLARSLGMKVMVGCMTETSCAVTAAAQLSPMVDYADLDGNLLIANDCFDGIKIVDGKITIPDRPGTGAIPL